MGRKSEVEQLEDGKNGHEFLRGETFYLRNKKQRGILLIYHFKILQAEFDSCDHSL